MKFDWPQRYLSYKQLVLIPITLIIFLGISAAMAFALNTFPLGKDFKEGSLIRVSGLENIGAEAIESAIEDLLNTDADVKPIRNGFDIEVDIALEENKRLSIREMFFENFGISKDTVMIETMGPTIIGVYSKQARNALIAAFIAMGVIIFIVFRHHIAAGMVLLAVGLDMLGVFGCMALFGVRLSLASVAGLLMLIGYAVDTNILLTTHVLKRVSEQPREQVVDAMRTGLMMSGSTLVPLFALNLLTTAPQLYELTAVLIFGITIDIFNTWFLNASIISRYVEKRKGRGYYVGI